MPGFARYSIFAASLAVNAVLVILIANALVDRVPAAPVVVDRATMPGVVQPAPADAAGSSAVANRAAENAPSTAKIAPADFASVAAVAPAVPGKLPKLTEPAAIALKMMEQGFPEDFIILLFRGAVMRGMEREQIAGLLRNAQRLRRWHPMLEVDPETAASLRSRQASEFEAGYREITRLLTPAERARFDQSAFGQVLLHPFGPPPVP